MSARIRLKRLGTKKRPFYRIIVIDRASARDGRTIDEVGVYHPIETEDKQVMFDAEKVKGWISKGATASDTVRKLLNRKEFYFK
ncbi:MAG: 30S ribosomal protein S16 [Spirochaetaceae bacterium]|jgi:small subunit ribosomal protein S16|nr:30S ribosomal protein S16 [Spirochaetaceae bacterium]